MGRRSSICQHLVGNKFTGAPGTGVYGHGRCISLHHQKYGYEGYIFLHHKQYDVQDVSLCIISSTDVWGCISLPHKQYGRAKCISLPHKQSGIGMRRYRTELLNAGMPMPIAMPVTCLKFYFYKSRIYSLIQSSVR